MTTTFPYLDLGSINTDSRIMRLLPPEIAYRYHALPIARDGNRITVAMAAPDDPAACNAVQAVIDSPLCLIQASGEEIDHRLDEIWPLKKEQLRFLFWPSSAQANQSYNVAKGLARPLEAELIRLDSPGGGWEAGIQLKEALSRWHPNLLIMQATHPSKLQRTLRFRKEAPKNYLMPDLLILPPDPSLPMQKIFLAIPDNGFGCQKAASWVLRLSRIHHLDVTILPVLPPLPPCYGSFLRYSLNTIMEGNDLLGSNMRSISRIFSQGDIHAKYILRDGDAFAQIREEINSFDPDMIIMPSPIRPGWEGWFSADLAGMLFKYTSKPFLITTRE